MTRGCASVSLTLDAAEERSYELSSPQHHACIRLAAIHATFPKCVLQSRFSLYLSVNTQLEAALHTKLDMQPGDIVHAILRLPERCRLARRCSTEQEYLVKPATNVPSILGRSNQRTGSTGRFQ
jgi:hypothetical protein